MGADRLVSLASDELIPQAGRKRKRPSRELMKNELRSPKVKLTSVISISDDLSMDVLQTIDLHLQLTCCPDCCLRKLSWSKFHVSTCESISGSLNWQVPSRRSDDPYF